MHEMGITKDILQSVIKYAENNDAKKVVSVGLSVGVMRDLVVDIFQKYWTFVCRGTIAEDSKITLNIIPSTCLCKSCNEVYDFDIKDMKKPVCPECGQSNSGLLTGREMRIDHIEIVN